MASVSDIISRSGIYEGLIQQLVQLEGQKKVQLEADKSDQVKIDKELGTISSKISTLENNLKEFTLLENKTFTSLTTKSSDESMVKIVSAEGMENIDEFSISVDRLASKDHIISQSYSANGTELDDLGVGEVTITIGDITKTISIATGLPPKPGNERTNQELLDELSTQIEAEFGDAVQANVYQVSEGQLQMSIRSTNVGYDARVQYSGSSGFLDSFFTNSSRQTPENELNASFRIDGIQFERSSNSITDTIPGLNFDLLTTTNNPVTMTVLQDTEKATSNFNSFMEAFNDLNKTIRSRTFINAETGSKGPLQGIRSIRNLSLNLRQIALLDANPAESTIRNLTELGVGFDKDGTMKIENQELFDGILTNTPEQLDQFFAASSSSITGMKNILNTYTESGGVIDSLETGVEQKTQRLDTRIAREEKYLLEFEDQQRAIFARLEQLTEQGMSQYNQVMMSLSNSGI
jgi:flagellar hook-associated protein 2